MRKEKFSIVLVVPPLVNAGVALTSLAGAEHVGIGYLASSLRRANFSVKIINSDIPIYVAIKNGKPIPRDKIPSLQDCARQILSYNPNLVGITITGPTLNIALKIAGYIREQRPSVHISFGGHQATATARRLLEEEKVIDSVGLGECDHTIIDLASRLNNGGSLEGLRGFIYRENGEIRGSISLDKNSVKRFNLDELPFPARDDLEIIHRQTELKEARLSSSRGCTEFCTFCADASQHYFQRYRMRSPGNVVAEFEYLNKTYGIEHFWLVDDNFLMKNSRSQERAHAIAQLIIKRRLFITIRAYFRPDAFEGCPELLPLLFKAGVVTGLIGVESGSPRRLKYLGKRNSLDTVRNIVSGMHKVGMGLQIGFIFFDPLTSFEDMRKDADFLYEINELYIMFNFIQNMDVYPETSYNRILKQKGLSTAVHPYRGGFRQYNYSDQRIALLASELERLYSDRLMGIDHAIWRVKIFNLPKLLWLTQWDKVNHSTQKKTTAFKQEVDSLCAALNQLHYDFIRTTIDEVDAGCGKKTIRDKFQILLHSRQPFVNRLLEIGREAADLLHSALH